jgi:hypothetical protein
MYAEFDMTDTNSRYKDTRIKDIRAYWAAALVGWHDAALYVVGLCMLYLVNTLWSLDPQYNSLVLAMLLVEM